MTIELLTPKTLQAYLCERGILETESASVTPLSGGVSNAVFLVETEKLRVVVKQALEKLNVVDDWYADGGRAQTEAAALQFLSHITPGRLPAVIDADPHQFTVTIEAAPSDWVTWKTQLMVGNTHQFVASELGILLARWQAVTRDHVPPSLSGANAFRQLRLEPYFRVTATRLPHLSQPILKVADILGSARIGLSLGDYSPKNVLVSPTEGKLWVIDLEVAHHGHIAFDVAFMSTHLMLKSLHLPETRMNLATALENFLGSYYSHGGKAEPAFVEHVVGSLLLARIVGTSPVEYLTSEEQERVLNIGTQLLTSESEPGKLLSIASTW